MVIEAYTDKYSYYLNDKVYVFPKTDNNIFDIYVFNIFTPKIILFNEKNIKLKQNKTIEKETFAEGSGWNLFYTFTLNNKINKSGLYVIRLVDYESQFYLPLIIKNQSITKPNIIVLMNSNMWNAYNTWGGSSYYRKESHIQYKSEYFQKHGPTNVITFKRPNPLISNEICAYITQKYKKYKSHCFFGEMYLLEWLYNKNIEYDLICDRDLHDNYDIKQYKIFMMNCHPEYWTTNMIENVHTNAQNVISLAGNCIFREVEYNGHQMKKISVYGWGRCFPVTGSYYTDKGYDTYAPFKLYFDKKKDPFFSWIFDGIEDEIIGLECRNNENNEKKGKGCSGHETDKIIYTKLSNKHIIGRGMNKNGSGGDILYFIYENKEKTIYRHIFSTGSVVFAGSLSVDKNIERMVSNVIDKFSL